MHVFYNGEPEFHECLKENQAKYHKSCANGYDKQKLQRIVDNKAKEKRKDSLSSPSVPRSSQRDRAEHLHAAGSYHAKKSGFKASRGVNPEVDNIKVVGDENLLSLFSTGDLAANEIYYHCDCYKDMAYRCKKIEKDNNNEIKRGWPSKKC